MEERRERDALPLSDPSSESLCAGGRCLYVYGELAGAPRQMPVRVPRQRGHRRCVLGIISLPAIAQRTTFINYSAVAAQQRAEKVSLRTDGCRLSVLMERRLEVDRSVSRHVNLHDVFVLEGERFPPSGHKRLKLELEVHRCCWENFPTDH
ncbi:hypothetical protein DPX16_9435 [Anabarilius grahami]|uniref:Uncharacterized protein n=1 Tax=Anabarilius grahami TaxID=495550 RepID=A0A3N0Y6V7_ANAGA|nr:hypothetical protein DPX16_9435 [Anabarilius grahami]